MPPDAYLESRIAASLAGVDPQAAYVLQSVSLARRGSHMSDEQAMALLGEG